MIVYIHLVWVVFNTRKHGKNWVVTYTNLVKKYIRRNFVAYTNGDESHKM